MSNSSIPTDADLVEASPNEAIFEAERESKEQFREALETSIAAGQGAADDDADYEASRPYLDELEARYGRGAHETLKELIDIEQQLRTNPESGSAALMDWYLTHGQKAGTEQKKGQHPDGSIAAELSKALDQSKRDSERRDAIREIQKVARERGTPSFSAFLKDFVALDAQMAKDPRYHSARMAARYGMRTEASDMAERAQLEQYLAPRTAQVRALWSTGAMRSTGDMLEDMRATAYALQKQEHAEAWTEVSAEVAAFKKSHKDFDAVKGETAKLLKDGKVTTLEAAYKQAKRGSSLRGMLQNEFERSRRA